MRQQGSLVPLEPVLALRDLIEEVDRELRLRNLVYRRRVNNGDMQRTDANRQIRRMTAVLELLRGLPSDTNVPQPHMGNL